MTYTIKPSDIYINMQYVPLGWRVIAFRPPKLDEYYFDLNYEIKKATGKRRNNEPRLILDRIWDVGSWWK